ncbi:MAG: radical SAM protein [Candidatus Bathyarchaeia archaeon]|nr:radical SAM protein [Candidatus Bathyarchaeota archaeon]
MNVIHAEIFIDDDGKVKISKICSQHGFYIDTYTFSDPELYEWAQKYSHAGKPIDNPRTEIKDGCPYDCGICPNHKSHTVLAIIDVTNRCNLECPICFANAATTGYVYEPSKNDIEKIIKNLRSNIPIPPPALQLSGGEPTVRGDLPELVRIAKDQGFRHVEVNTNGVRLAKELSYFKDLIEAGMDTIYLQFDGVDDNIYKKTRGVRLYDLKMRVIENAREIGFESIVLVVTLVRGVNDHQVGEIVKFALKNSDVVRCVNVQPVSITGRIDSKEREAMRINTTDFMKLVEEQTSQLIKVEDFFPVPSVIPISEAVGHLRSKGYVLFSTSPWCGVATFMVKTKSGEWVPITKLANVDKFFHTMESVCRDVEDGHRIVARLRMLTALRHVKASFIKEFLWPVLKTGSYEALGRFMRRVVMVGCMHFMDPYNFDLERLERCVIHYGLPDGTIRPFCSVNTLHRSKVERAFSKPYDEWKKRIQR